MPRSPTATSASCTDTRSYSATLEASIWAALPADTSRASARLAMKRFMRSAASPRAAPADRIDLEVRPLLGLVPGDGFLALVVQRLDEVAAADQVVQDPRCLIHHLRVVGLDQRELVRAPQVATAVVGIGQRDEVAVFVDEQAALGVDVRHAGLERGLDLPDAVQLVAQQLGLE